MKIRAILFDLGNVLVDYRPEIFITRLSERVKIGKEKLVRYFLTSTADIEYTEGKISSDEFFKIISRDLSLNCSQEEFWDFWCNIFIAKHEMDALVARLKKSYPVWILSNTNEWHFEFLKSRFPVLDMIDQLFLSYQLKCQKPDEKVYEHVIRKSGLKPDEIFFTDDITVNIEAARKSGLRASLFKSAAELNLELNQMGVL
ncbi:MAG: HAD family phosphatase [Candidatus Omnitrophica bacterium]|nr:HAD family phosphatase [Candidatus Omnitrophota bacterium]